MIWLTPEGKEIDDGITIECDFIEEEWGDVLRELANK